MNTQHILSKKIRRTLLLFIALLLLSGLTAFPLETELRMLSGIAGWFPASAEAWIRKVYLAVKETNEKYPFLSYGTDWLAFAHIVLSVAFIGPLRDPVRNIWVIEFGMFACVMVFPLAFIAGGVRGIPFYWQLIDCSFGVGGFLLLWLCHRMIRQLEYRQKLI